MYTSSAQNTFEKGYIINNSDQKTECLIKNLGWKDNPSSFEYKISETSESIIESISNIKEFGINSEVKYVRMNVMIDKSSSNLNFLDHVRNPVFINETYFLKVLIEGTASLYIYEEGNLHRYFYAINNSEIEQLVYKSYLTELGQIGTNELFKQQLFTTLKCESIGQQRIENLNYNTTSLLKLFVEFNMCSKSNYKKYESKERKDLFNINLRLHLNNSSLSFSSGAENDFNYYNNFNFSPKQNIGFGVETEFLLPYYKHNWSILFEPTYQSYKESTTKSVSNLVGGLLLTDISYSSIELPIGLRHYFYINKNSNIFVNASYIIDINFNSSILFKRADNSILKELDLKSDNNFSLGIGSKIKNKYSLELRLQSGRDIIGNPNWTSNYKTISLIFGYSIL
jgi:hypothetical protein